MDKNDFQIRAIFRQGVKLAAIPDGARLLLAVSGGCDSVTLLHLCLDEVRSRGWNLIVGHVDHGLRPDSGSDALWVKALSASLSLPFSQATISPESWQIRNGRSLEELARRRRRAHLLSLAESARADWILLGHTLDDQAETILLNLLRGTGLRGLRGMPATYLPWVRPLLRIRRPDLREYALRRGLTWREDPTNQDPAFVRNRLRLRVLPILEQEFSPAVVRSLSRTAEIARLAVAYLQEETGRAFTRVCSDESSTSIRFDRIELTQCHPAIIEELIRTACRRLRGTRRDLGRAHVEPLSRTIRLGRTGKFALPGQIRVIADRGAVWFHREPAKDLP